MICVTADMFEFYTDIQTVYDIIANKLMTFGN